MKHRIALIVPYFGTLPKYFYYFIQSVENKSFYIYFFTDINKPDNLPVNVYWQQTTLQMMKSMFEKQLETSVALNDPYKFCDLKPSYGLVFEKYLIDYDFWGTIDIDTIIGNFANFINDELLNRIDILSVIQEYLSGSFFLIRNNDYCNNLFKKSKDWKHVFTNEQNFIFDECGGHYFEQLKKGKSIFELNTPIQSFTEILLLEQNLGLRILFADYLLEPKGLTPVLIENGIIYKKKEYPIVHLIYFKMRYYFYVSLLPLNEKFYINVLGFFNSKPNIVTTFLSINFLAAIKKKIQINIKKLNTKY